MPTRSGALARLPELLLPARLHPEARVDAEGGARVVGVPPLGAQPAPLEQRTDDVAPVAQRVDERRPRERLRHRRQHERGLGGLLDGAAAADEAEATDTVEDRPDLLCRDVRNRGLEWIHLAEVGEAGERADRAGEERRARPRAAEDEDEPVVETSQRRAPRQR